MTSLELWTSLSKPQQAGLLRIRKREFDGADRRGQSNTYVSLLNKGLVLSFAASNGHNLWALTKKGTAFLDEVAANREVTFDGSHLRRLFEREQGGPCPVCEVAFGAACLYLSTPGSEEKFDTG